MALAVHVGGHAEDPINGPVGFHERDGHDVRAGERLQYLGLAAVLKPAGQALGDEQVRGTGEADAVLEQHRAPKLLSGRTDLAWVVPEEGREHLPLQVIGDAVQAAAEERVQLVALPLGHLLEELQGHHPAGLLLVVHFHGLVDVGPRRADPVLVLLRGWAVLGDARLREEGAVQPAESVLEVSPPEPFVLVGQDREAHGDVRVRELTGVARGVLAAERHRHFLPRLAGRGVLLQLLCSEQPELYAVSLLEAVWQEGMQPGAGQPEVLLVDDGKLQGPGYRRFRQRVRDDVVQDILFGPAAHSPLHEPRHHPLGHDVLHLRVVETGVQQQQVWAQLEQETFDPLCDDLPQAGDDLQQLRRHVAGDEGWRQLHHPQQLEQVQRQLPSEGPEVELLLGTIRKIQLADQGVQEHIHLVHDHHRGLSPLM
mmetsp:Transcript_74140/g.130889  ORF Transcript_74140/g.130889 Transcript_74140/m.130889 type:complete len:426 (-) Transcript_74140:373-1650(-)